MTRHRFALVLPNLHQICILRYAELVLKMGVIDLNLQGHFDLFDLEFLKIWLVRSIMCDVFELESPNWHQIYILGFSQIVLKMEVIDLDLQCHLAVSTQETTFNVALVYWSKLTKGCYTSQTCSCDQKKDFSAIAFFTDAWHATECYSVLQYILQGLDLFFLIVGSCISNASQWCNSFSPVGYRFL